MSHDPELDELKREYLTETEAKVQEIFRLMSQGSKEARDRMIYLAHQLKGSGGSYGFPSISSDAAALENALEKMQDGGAAEVRKEVERRVQSLTNQVAGQLSRSR